MLSTVSLVSEIIDEIKPLVAKNNGDYYAEANLDGSINIKLSGLSVRTISAIANRIKKLIEKRNYRYGNVSLISITRNGALWIADIALKERGEE